MFAIIACILFVLAFFSVAPAGFDLVPLGLAFLALHFVVGSIISLPFRRD